MKKATRILELISEDSGVYYNDLSLEDNLISYIIRTTEDARKVFEFKYRDKIRLTAKIEIISSKNGSLKAYSPVFDMIALEV